MVAGGPAPQSSYLLSHVGAATLQIALPVIMLRQANPGQLTGDTFSNLQARTGRVGQALDPRPLAVDVAECQDPPLEVRSRQSFTGRRGDLLLIAGLTNRKEIITKVAACELRDARPARLQRERKQTSQAAVGVANPRHQRGGLVAVVSEPAAEPLGRQKGVSATLGQLAPARLEALEDRLEIWSRTKAGPGVDSRSTQTRRFLRLRASSAAWPRAARAASCTRPMRRKGMRAVRRPRPPAHGPESPSEVTEVLERLNRPEPARKTATMRISKSARPICRARPTSVGRRYERPSACPR